MEARDSTKAPLAYFISFRTYGTWLRGDERSWTRKSDGRRSARVCEADEALRARDLERMTAAPFQLSPEAQCIAADTIQQVCAFLGWACLVLSVDHEHVHLVVIAGRSPEHVMNTLKAWVTRRLREAGLVASKERIWSRHGSTRRLWNATGVERASAYVLRQSAPHARG